MIVGRCADYILRDNPDCLSFFIHNNKENRIQRIIESQNLTVEQAEELMLKTDKSRAAYYNYYEEFCGTENGQASAAFRIIIISLPSTYHRGALLYRLRLYPLNLPDNAVKGKGRITK